MGKKDQRSNEQSGQPRPCPWCHGDGRRYEEWQGTDGKKHGGRVDCGYYQGRGSV